MKYKYSGIELSSKQRVEGEIDALSHQEAVRLLADKRIEAFAVNQLEEHQGKGKKVVVADLVIPLQELATLSASGVALIDAVRALSKNKEHPNLAKGFMKIASRIEGGSSLSEGLRESGLPFPKYVEHLVSAGELGGQLAMALNKASEQLNYEQSVKNDIRSALTYPLVLISAGLGAMLIIFFAVVPKFSHLLNDDKELPTLAYIVLSAGQYANESPYTILAFVLALVFGLVVILTNPKVQSWLMDFALELPVVGPWLAEQDAARWASLCSAMLTAKVNLVAALKLAAQSCEFTKRRNRAHTMINDVEAGVSFTEALERARLVPNTSLNLVSVGDKTGQLAEMLKSVAALHDASCKRRMKQVLTLVEPIAILVVGAMLGVIILGVVLAITASTDIAI
ncbi:type II secretion system F family protein [Paraglaciecola aestuariivivens]